MQRPLMLYPRLPIRLELGVNINGANRRLLVSNVALSLADLSTRPSPRHDRSAMKYPPRPSDGNWDGWSHELGSEAFG